MGWVWSWDCSCLDFSRESVLAIFAPRGRRCLGVFVFGRLGGFGVLLVGVAGLGLMTLVSIALLFLVDIHDFSSSSARIRNENYFLFSIFSFSLRSL